MRNDTRYGAFLIAGSAVLLAMTAVHPSSIPFGDAAALSRLVWVDGFAHALAIVGVWLLLVGQIGLARMLGLQRSLVVTALVAAALPAAGIMVAAALDGFVIPKLAEDWMRADAGVRTTQEQLVRFCWLVASALTRIYMLLVAVAVLLWSWAIRRDRLDAGLPWLGAVVGVAGIGTLFGGPASVSVHELLVLVLGQSSWMVWAGVMMIRGGRADEAVREYDRA
jgi:hypothetical protein